MSAPSGQPTPAGTEARNHDTYQPNHGGVAPSNEWVGPHSRAFFTMVAERIRAVTNPSSVLDVGCGPGLLVQALCEQGVDAYGIDMSEHAIENAHPDVSPRLSVGSPEQIAGAWDLITCIDVLEVMESSAAERAIDSMCATSDKILVSSTPSGFTTPTNINIREPAAWAASFAERGHFRRTDVDLSFLAPWAVLFARADVNIRDLVYRYEHYAYPMRAEVLEKRAALLDAYRKRDELDAPGSESAARSSDLRSRLDELQNRLDEVTALNLELRHKLLTSRDHAIGAEAEAAQWRRRHEQVAAELEARRGRVYTAYRFTRRLAKAILRRLSKLRTRHR